MVMHTMRRMELTAGRFYFNTSDKDIVPERESLEELH